MKTGTPSLQQQFHREVLGLYDRCASLGFRPVLLRRYIVLNGGVAAAKELVFKPGTTGLERLLDLGKAEMSLEATMLRPEFRPLFTEPELKEARQRLESAGRTRSRGKLMQPSVSMTPRRPQT